MQKTFLLPVLAAAVMAGCSSAPKHSAPSCEPGQAAAAGYVEAAGKILMSDVGSMVKTGYWKPEHGAAFDCESKVMVATVGSEGVAAGPGAGMEGVAADGRVRLDARMLFDFDSALLTDSGKVELDLLINDINAMAVIDQIMVIGHTDSVGSMSYNQMLSERRAGSVRDYLIAQMAELKITAEGRGESEPIANNATEQGRAKNRRVEVIVDGSMEAMEKEAAATVIAPVVDKMTAMIRKLTN